MMILIVDETVGKVLKFLVFICDVHCVMKNAKLINKLSKCFHELHVIRMNYVERF